MNLHKKKEPGGFTLIELLVVLLVLSIALFVVTPRFVGFVNPERNKNFMTALQNTLVYLDEKAILKKQVYLFVFDLDERMYYITLPGDEEAVPVREKYLMPVRFPANVEVAGVRSIPGEEISEGRMVVPFTPTGFMLSFEIMIREEDERLLVLQGNGINGRIELFKTNERNFQP